MIRARCPASTLLAICLAGSGCGRGRPTRAADAYPGWTPVFEQLATPAIGSALAPQLTVGGERTILSWLEKTDVVTNLKFAERTASGWSEPRVAASGRDFVTNASDVPSVRATGDGLLTAHWNREYGEDPEAYSLLLSSSRDGGRTWSAAATPHHDTTKTQHGFASLFHQPDAALGVVWLDGRTTNPAAPDDPQSTMALWAAVYDGSGRQISEAAVDPRVCDCCQTSVAETSEGVIVAYRGRTADEVRDISVVRFAGGQWSPPVAVHHDGWKIHGCPVNGPAVDARGRHVAVAWFTASTSDGQAFVAFSDDAGRTFAAPIRVDDEACSGHVDVELLADGSAAVSWTEIADEHGEVKVRRVQQNGTRSAAARVAQVSNADYPRLAHAPGELLLAWSALDNGSPRVHVARAAVPAAAQP